MHLQFFLGGGSPLLAPALRGLLTADTYHKIVLPQVRGHCEILPTSFDSWLSLFFFSCVRIRIQIYYFWIQLPLCFVCLES